MRHTSLSQLELDKLGSSGLSVLEDPTLTDRERKQDVISQAEELGLNHLGSGAGRIVFADAGSNSVIKIPYSSGRNVGGVTQNKNEFTYWDQTDYKNCFFEVYEVSNTNQPIWLVMKCATYTMGDTQFDLSEAQAQLSDDLSVSRSHEVLDSDNIGYDAEDDRYKVIDYGSYLTGI